MCDHLSTIIDRHHDVYVCTDCALVLDGERPSLSDPSSTTCTDVRLPPNTRECLTTAANALGLRMDETLRAATLVRNFQYTSRHPASVAACALHCMNDPPTLREAETLLKIDHKTLSRAVSRILLRMTLQEKK